jgi:hypothetical protein
VAPRAVRSACAEAQAEGRADVANSAIGARLPGWRVYAPAPGGQARADFA